MNISIVNGFGKCIECGKHTSYQMWVGKMQFFFCEYCIKNIADTATRVVNNIKIENIKRCENAN